MGSCQQNIQNQNIQNNISGNVKLVKFGDEDLSCIKDDVYKKILNSGFKSVPNLIEHVHFNTLNPDNQILQGSTSPWAPSLEPALNHPDVVKNISFAGVIRDSYLYPVDAGFSADRNQWVELLSNEVSLALTQKKSAKDALNDAVKQINASRS